ncbi:hypothetical protein [Sunxiuqinia elliptica]|uniref:SpoIIAA-like n=1 Tax=Sunxiuqinia elliptica TaxID=655355 RepID=A0A4R6GT21_9BACT|nr:hypothetical protein [Sunxiuqinia elliptica]TDN97735.1 hypothetical protein DET52_109137 [Sunxiuqinia elliptica]TDO55813.1 hypothetical protein DET65_4352 [Sunxiuqinia elliptica]
MSEKFKYQFDSSLGILFKYYYGLISIKDIESSWEYAFENGLIPKETKGFILDYRKSNFNIKIDEHTVIAEFYKKHLDVFGNFKIAILTEEYRDIVIPILVKTKDEGYSSRPFSTLEAAIEWVLS